ncbi:Protein of unknown function (DUF3037) [Rheinheimera sp. A13L]|uniref:DUF3037 domain-containing protein n=1 Tax=Rheinheimera sp. A13L TaxID=506534 RepID=UPI000212505E|nr:DUF3037 domain-containing protein [Rheinheimera sp. A13L]EGM79553.1 Protein of unknown function (DUF3037) [Rheinheimera sp. A13L]
MKTIYQYAIVRFLPFAETGEFANVGIVLCAPDVGVFAFQLIPTPSERVQLFFPRLNNDLLPNTLKLLTDELNRIQQLAEQHSSTQLFATFQELIRPREQLIRYSGQRSVLSAAKPAELLAQLIKQLVQL